MSEIDCSCFDSIYLSLGGCRICQIRQDNQKWVPNYLKADVNSGLENSSMNLMNLKLFIDIEVLLLMSDDVCFHIYIPLLTFMTLWQL